MAYKLKKGESAPKDGYLVLPKEWDTIQKTLRYVVADKIAHDRIKNTTISSEVTVWTHTKP